MRDDPEVLDLVTRARGGDLDAWSAIVDRYAALVWGVCRRHGLSRTDAEDVGGHVWLMLVERLDGLREPAALPGWIATTTQRECLRHLRGRVAVPVDELADRPDATLPDSDEALVVEEDKHALRLAFAALGERCRALLALLFRDPPSAYAEISVTLDMPVGAIGPTRARCLDQLRRHPVLAGVGA